MTISPEAKEAASKLVDLHYPPDMPHMFGKKAEQEVQLAINSATALLQEEIRILKKIEAHANEKLSNSNHHSVFESIDDAALTLIEQRKEIKSLKEELERAKNDRNKAGVIERQKYLPEIARLRGEVEKAYMEGFSDYKTFYPSNGYYKFSRAKRVVEGKE